MVKWAYLAPIAKIRFKMASHLFPGFRDGLWKKAWNCDANVEIPIIGNDGCTELKYALKSFVAVSLDGSSDVSSRSTVGMSKSSR